MKRKKHVISQTDLPSQFGWWFWVITYLIIDKIDPNDVVWYVYGTMFFVWTFIFGYVKSIEKPFSIVSFKDNIEQWLNND